MSAGRKAVACSLSVAALATAIFLPEAVSFAAGSSETPVTDAIAAETAPLVAQTASELQTPSADAAAFVTPQAEPAAGADAAAATADPTDPELVCMAKVVRHEAANQPRRGQLAVAQLIMNRLKSPLFPKTVCGVVHQAGQFFNTNSYHPSRTDEAWKTAWAVSVDARRAVSESVIGKAIYYNATAGRSAFHASRKHAATIGGHSFFY